MFYSHIVVTAEYNCNISLILVSNEIVFLLFYKYFAKDSSFKDNLNMIGMLIPERKYLSKKWYSVCLGNNWSNDVIFRNFLSS